MEIRLVVVVVALTCLCWSCDGLVQKGKVATGNNWQYLGKFCYAKGKGQFLWNTNSAEHGMQMLLYVDNEDWTWAWKNHKTASCEELKARSAGTRNAISGIEDLVVIKDSIRPHYWFFAMANCNASRLEFDYDVECLNPGGYFLTQFSYDYMGICEIYLVFVLIFFVGTLIHFSGAYTLIRSNSYHPLVRLLSGAVIMEAMSLILIFGHYSVYTMDGIGLPGLFAVGEVLDMISNLIFMLLLILLACGWCITTYELQRRTILTVVMCAFFLGYVVLFVWINYFQDDANTTFIYITIPGILHLVLRGITYVYFLACLVSTYRQEPDDFKRSFYVKFGACCTVWFLGLPVIAILAAMMAEWVRFRVVQGLYLSLVTVAYFTMCWLMWPTKSSKYFQLKKPDTLLGTPTSPFSEL